MKEKHVKMYAEMASTIAKQSYAERLKVGAVVVKDHRILAASYNGTPPGADNICEDESGKTKSDVIHAEMNAIFRMARDGQSGKGADLFVTTSPCFECAKAILSVGIKRVWFREQYRDLSGLELLRNYNIEVEHLGDKI